MGGSLSKKKVDDLVFRSNSSAPGYLGSKRDMHGLRQNFWIKKYKILEWIKIMNRTKIKKQN